jgi:hypothetical protein
MSDCVVTDSATTRPLTASERLDIGLESVILVLGASTRSTLTHTKSNWSSKARQRCPPGSFGLGAIQTGVASATEQCD